MGEKVLLCCIVAWSINFYCSFLYGITTIVVDSTVLSLYVLSKMKWEVEGGLHTARAHVEHLGESKRARKQEGRTFQIVTTLC